MLSTTTKTKSLIQWYLDFKRLPIQSEKCGLVLKVVLKLRNWTIFNFGNIRKVLVMADLKTEGSYITGTTVFFCQSVYPTRFIIS